MKSEGCLRLTRGHDPLSEVATFSGKGGNKGGNFESTLDKTGKPCLINVLQTKNGFITTDEGANLLGITKRQMKRHCQRGTFVTRRAEMNGGWGYEISVESILDWLDRKGDVQRKLAVMEALGTSIRPQKTGLLSDHTSAGFGYAQPPTLSDRTSTTLSDHTSTTLSDHTSIRPQKTGLLSDHTSIRPKKTGLLLPGERQAGSDLVSDQTRRGLSLHLLPSGGDIKSDGEGKLAMGHASLSEEEEKLAMGHASLSEEEEKLAMGHVPLSEEEDVIYTYLTEKEAGLRQGVK